MAFQTRTVLGVPEQLRTQLNLNRYSGYGFMIVTAFGLAQRSNLQTILAWVDIGCWPRHWCDQSNLADKRSAQYDQPCHFGMSARRYFLYFYFVSTFGHTERENRNRGSISQQFLYSLSLLVTPANLIEGKNITPKVRC